MKSKKYLHIFLKTLLLLIVSVGLYRMIAITFPYFSFETDIAFLLTKQSVLHIDIWLWSFYLHITASLFVLAFGVIQFIRPILVNAPGFHRNIGKAYIAFILLISAPSGLVMAYYANGGFWAQLSFSITSALWWFFTFKAYTSIRNQNITAHIHFMVRSYALTLSAISLRIYVMVLPGFIHLHAKEMYTLVAWLSWVPNLLIAEWIIKNKTITAPQSDSTR